MDNRGIKTTDELKKLVQDYQSGQPEDAQQPAIDASNTSYYQTAKRDVTGGVNADYTQEALTAGYGTRRYDKEFYAGEDIEDRRAAEQSGLSKMTNYLGKGLVTAATTYANGTAGLVAGLVAGAYEAAFDPNKDGRHVIDAMVNNPFSQYMETLRDWSDKAMPTYLSAEQRSEEYQKEWYKHMFTTDFAGEFLQNFGFTVGAMLSGATWTKGFSLLKSKAFANNILKGAVVASEGDAAAAEELKRAYDILKKGRLTKIDGDKLTQNLKDIAKKINRANTDVQLFGATVGAMAEGDMEGIMARKEMLDDFNQRLSDEHKEKYTQALDDVLGSNNPDWVVASSEFDPVTGQFTPMLTDAGKAEVLRRQQEITANENDQINKANLEGDRMASITFGLNIPVLTASNMAQFGRMLSGGWKTSRKLYSVQGGVNIAKDAITGAYRAQGSVPVKTVFKSLKNIVTEGSEEMIQGFISSGNKKYAMENIASFNNAAYDEQSIDTVRDWLTNFSSGGLDYLKDPKNWKEGALGGLTGLFGIPGRRWNGGVLGARAEAKEEVNASRDAAERMNTLVNNPEFRARWNGYIRHMAYDNQIADALAKDDEYAWRTADDAQLISDVVTFADADRLDDLVDIAQSFKQVTADDIQSLKTNLDWAKGLSNEQITKKISDQTDRMIATVQEYRDMYEALASRAPVNASKEFLQELVVTAQHIKAYERRFQSMLEEVAATAEPLLVSYSQSSTETEEEQKKTLNDLKSFFKSVLDASPVKYIPDEVIEDIDKRLSVLMRAAKWDDATKDKITDMRKVIADRQLFYRKLQFLQGETKNEQTGEPVGSDKAQAAFEKASITPKKVEEAAAKANVEDEIKSLNTVDAVRQAYRTKKGKDQVEFFEDLRKAAKKNPAIKTFVEMKEFADGFRGFVERTALNPENQLYNTRLIKAVNNLIDYAESVDDMKGLTDSVFESYDSFAKNNSTVFGPPQIARYDEIKSALRDAMKTYLDASSQTQAKVQEKPVEDNTSPEKKTEGGGYDAAPPASATGEPDASKLNEKPEKSKEPQKVTITDPNREEPSESEIEYMALESQEEERPDVYQNLEFSIQKEDGKWIIYYRTSVPEIDTEENTKARNAIKDKNTDEYKKCDLSDFVDKHPEYADIWNALSDRGAFDYVSENLELGDEVEFIIDPTFPTYKGEPQILMATRNDTGLHILSVLTYKSNEYLGVKSLRNKILDEYKEFNKTHQNEVYVFGKKSRVFAIRPGVIEYKWDKSSEKPIQNIPSYKEDAYIVANLKDPETNTFETVGVRGGNEAKIAFDTVANSHIGNRYGIYYLVESNAGNIGYIPVRIFPARFTAENYREDNPVFDDIRQSVHKIAEIVSDADGTNYPTKRDEMHKAFGELSHKLDIHTSYFTLKADESGVSLLIAPDSFDDSKTKEEKATPRVFNVQYADVEQTYDWILRQLSKMNRHIQIDATTSPDKLKQMIDANLLTSNCQRLRMKGVDFWCDPWDDKAGDFVKPVIQQTEETEETPTTQPEETPLTEGFDPSYDAWLAAAENASEMPDADAGIKVPFDLDVTEIYNSRDTTKEADKGKPGRKEILEALYEANPKIVQFKNDADRVNAIDKVIELARQYPELAISRQIFDLLPSIVDKTNQNAYDVRSEKAKDEVLNQTGELTLQQAIKLDFDELPENIKQDLISKNYDAETYDELSDDMRERIISCSFVQ